MLALAVALYAICRQNRDISKERRRQHELEILRRIGELPTPDVKVDGTALIVDLRMLPGTTMPMKKFALLRHPKRYGSAPYELLEQLLDRFDYRYGYSRLKARV